MINHLIVSKQEVLIFLRHLIIMNMKRTAIITMQNTTKGFLHPVGKTEQLLTLELLHHSKNLSCRYENYANPALLNKSEHSNTLWLERNYQTAIGSQLFSSLSSISSIFSKCEHSSLSDSVMLTSHTNTAVTSPRTV